MSDTTTERRVRQPVKQLNNERAVLAWLARQPNQTTRATNRAIAGHLDLPLDEGRIQNRRLSEALAGLRSRGLIRVLREDPHPVESPAGRAIVMTDAGRDAVAEELS
jgi:hypothetical protein